MSTEKEARILDFIPEGMRAQLKKEVIEEMEAEKNKKPEVHPEIKAFIEKQRKEQERLDNLKKENNEKYK